MWKYICLSNMETNVFSALKCPFKGKKQNLQKWNSKLVMYIVIRTEIDIGREIIVTPDFIIFSDIWALHVEHMSHLMDVITTECTNEPSGFAWSSLMISLNRFKVSYMNKGNVFLPHMCSQHKYTTNIRKNVYWLCLFVFMHPYNLAGIISVWLFLLFGQWILK